MSHATLVAEKKSSGMLSMGTWARQRDWRAAARSTRPHSGEGIAALCRLLREQDIARGAVEWPDGVLVERLLEAGIVVVAVHPIRSSAAVSATSRTEQVRSLRRLRAGRARTHMHRLRAIKPDSDETKALRTSSARARTSSRRDRAGQPTARPTRALLARRDHPRPRVWTRILWRMRHDHTDCVGVVAAAGAGNPAQTRRPQRMTATQG